MLLLETQRLELGAMVTVPSLGSATAASSPSGPPTIAPAAKAPLGCATAASSASRSLAPAAKSPFLMLECVMNDHGVHLSCDDLKCLNDNTDIFDSIIDFTFARISLKFNNYNDIMLLRISIAFLLAGLQANDALQVLSKADLERLQSCRLVFVPVNDDTAYLGDSGRHWSLLVIHIAEDRASCRYVHHDSKGDSNLEAAKRYAAALKPLFPMAIPNEVIQAETPHQGYTRECGLAVLTLTTAICSWWNQSGRCGESNCWFEMVKSNITAKTYADMRVKLRNRLKRLALATATAAVLDSAAGTGAVRDLATATPLPAPSLKCKVQDKEMKLFCEDIVCLGQKETFVVDNVLKFIYTRISLIFQGQDLLLLWPMHDFLIGEDTEVEAKAKSLLGSCRMVLLPVSDNMNPRHWSLLVVQIARDRSSCQFFHHDLGGLNKNAAMKYIEALQRLLPDAPQPVIEDPIAQQINAFDCGLYVLCLTKAICTWWSSSGRSGNIHYSFNEVNSNISARTLADTRVKLRRNLMNEFRGLASSH